MVLQYVSSPFFKTNLQVDIFEPEIKEVQFVVFKDSATLIMSSFWTLFKALLISKDSVTISKFGCYLFLFKEFASKDCSVVLPDLSVYCLCFLINRNSFKQAHCQNFP